MNTEKFLPELIVEHFPYINYTFCLNKYNFIQEIQVNHLDIDLENIELEISSSLGIIDQFQVYIDKTTQSTLKIYRFDFTFNLQLLKNLTEKDIDTIKIILKANNEEIAQKQFSIDVLPMDYFGGLQVLPQLLSSYIISNHPAVYEIKTAAIKILEDNNLKPAFEGYQSHDKTRVLQIVSSIYKAIQNQELVYSSMPPSFENHGQRIRLIDQVISTKFGNCIDISLLFAACLEAVDLNPILIITKGHAFVGVWLENHRFDAMTIFDQTAISKRIATGIKEIALIETTNLCRGASISFSEAMINAEIQLMKADDFLLAIDVKNCRSNGISPLPIIKSTTEIGNMNQFSESVDDTTLDDEYDLGESYDNLELTDLTNLTKQKIWERKLLDLSLRNNLLNIRFTKSMLQIVDLKINLLEDTLAEGKTYTIHPDNNQPITRKYNNYSAPLHSSLPLFTLANDEFQYNRLLTTYHSDDLDMILTNLYRSSKLAEEENGKSTLYLGIGLLKWFDPKNNQMRLAPILLIPVELSRKSVNSKFTLRSREEETMINITLIEYLKQEFKLNLNALENLPMDDFGVDVARVLAIVRNAILNLEGWDVLEQIVLGTFSFNKLILWQDISKYSNEIQKSSIVKSLIDGKLATTLESVEGNDAELETMPAAELTLPISADNSQLNAVKNANLNKTFILHGPPGTGKSQTITNIIADALSNDKKVLFVAAKKAALDVVHHRLENIGLGPFTLELHSNKSKKSDVLQQFEQTLETPKYHLNKDFEEEGKRLDERRSELNKYVTLLHQKNAIGWSLFDSISFLENNKVGFDEKYKIAFTIDDLDTNQWNLWSDWIVPFHAIVSKIGQPSAHPLKSVKLITHQFENQTNLIHAIDRYIQSKRNSEIIFAEYNINDNNDLKAYSAVVKFIQEHTIKPALFDYYFNEERYIILRNWINLQIKKQEIETLVLPTFNKNILTYNAESLQFLWNQSKHTWFLPKWLKQRKVKSQLQGYAHKKLNSEQEIDQIFENLEAYKSVQNNLKESNYLQFEWLHRNYLLNEQFDAKALDNDIENIHQLNELVIKTTTKNAKEWIVTNFNEQDISKNTSDILVLLNDLDEAKSNLLTYLYEIELVEDLQTIKNNIQQLEDWINYNAYKSKANELSLNWLIEKLENSLVDSNAIEFEFQKILHLNHFIQSINQTEVFNRFDASIYESQIKQYKDLYQEFITISKNQLIVKLSSNIPNFNQEAAQSSEIGILQKAIRSRGRGLSIRKLFDQIPTLIPRLKPCMLMSPISVAQYFDVNTDHFDLVIFDEASQLPTSEAISALARAKQAIIVGDPKQMPPTSFFASSKVDEDNLEIEDLESILDDCLALSIPSNYLLRHYRSKHESLISFSNQNFYDSKLLTFPSPDDLNQKVTFDFVEGFYDKGKSRTNKNEAAAVINYIKNHLLSKNKKSLGVVTFSQTQQSLIEDLLQKLYQENPTLEEIAFNNEEPIFIKNLENVQGDERDIILFSIGYGPDEEGKVSMNFGPLNRDGGWRRLNVAVTRARYEMKIFSSLRGDQIDLSRTKSEGVKGLKDFLNFAEKGNFVLKSTNEITSNSSIVDAIANYFTENGLSIKKYIGTSDYKVDIGILHPENDKEYILGILVDGTNYYDIHTTNDRELLVPNVLKGLGWNIYRIWTLDWLKNKDKIVAKIKEEIQGILSQPKFVEEKVEEKISVEEPLKSTIEFLEVTEIASNNFMIPYEFANIENLSSANSETIYYPENRVLILNQIKEIVRIEAPISKNLLFKKILKLWNISRAGAKLNTYITEIVSTIPEISKTISHQEFYWTNEKQPNNQTTYRNNSVEKRIIDDISQEEIQVAILEMMNVNLSLSKQDLIRLIAKTFGFLKVGSQIDAVVNQALNKLIEEGKLKEIDDRITL